MGCISRPQFDVPADEDTVAGVLVEGTLPEADLDIQPREPGLDPEDACGAFTLETRSFPLDMYVLLEKSASMSHAQWQRVEETFTGLFDDQRASEFRVALRFWPDSGCNGDNCGGIESCSHPQVALEGLDTTSHRDQMTWLIENTNLIGPTNLSNMMGGAALWAKQRAAESAAGTAPEAKTAVVLVTATPPDVCDEDLEHITAYAKDAYETAGAATFVVAFSGEGTNETYADAIAAAGGTHHPISIDAGDTAGKLLAALRAYRGEPLPCSYAMPESAGPDEEVNPSIIDVSLTPSDGVSVSLPRYQDLASCGRHQGFYYDDPAAPSRVLLCPSTCGSVQTDDAGKIEILVGCSPILY